MGGINNTKTSFYSLARDYKFFALYYFIFTVSLLAYSLLNPMHNWDLIAYVGSAKNFETNDKQKVSDYAYKELRTYVDKENYLLLTDSSNYRKTFFTDPESFKQVLPWYQIRPIYVGLMYGLNKVGINMYAAGHIISAISVFFGLWVYFFAFKEHISEILWFSVPFFVLMNGIVEVARIGTPDGLAFLATSVLTLFFIKHREKLFWALPLSIFVRTDLIFLIGLMLGYLFLRHKNCRIKAIISLIFAVTIYLLINGYFGNYGWASVFYLAFISEMNLNYPADAEINITLFQYLVCAVKGAVKLFIDDAFDMFAGLLAIQLVISLRAMGIKKSFLLYFNNPVYALAIISFAYVVVHFLIFPTGQSRFFSGAYLTVLLTFLATVNRIDTLKPAKIK